MTIPYRVVLSIATLAYAKHMWRIFLVLLIAVVGFLALSPNPPVSADLGWDKLNHIAAFTALAFTGYLSFSTSLRHQNLLLLGVLAFGGLIEIIQLFVPGRACEWGDLFADSIGITCGALAAAYLLKIARNISVE